jgi:hypothetical protein
VLAAVFLLALASSSCTHQVQRVPVAIAPTLSVEAFLQASNARDYDTMARLFGTERGPVAETGSTVGCAFRKVGSWMGMGQRCVRREEVELRMATIADILRHQDYRIVSDRLEPGRRHTTNRVGVDITRGGALVRDVPFLVVRSREGRWLVQEIDLQRLTGVGR